MTESVQDRQKMLEYQSYEIVAAEYYDNALHPTCSNFREASLSIIESFLAKLNLSGSIRFCEVGAGRSVFVDLERPLEFESALFVDNSKTMLGYTLGRLNGNAQFVCADARKTGVPNETVDLLISSLGDPYNDRAFWTEAGRILSPGGQILYTTPSIDWAIYYRADDESDKAVFTTSTGQEVAVPSYVYTRAEQFELISSAGLTDITIEDFSLKDLSSSSVSPKLKVSGIENYPIVTGYSAVKV